MPDTTKPSPAIARLTEKIEALRDLAQHQLTIASASGDFAEAAAFAHKAAANFSRADALVGVRFEAICAEKALAARIAEADAREAALETKGGN